MRPLSQFSIETEAIHVLSILSDVEDCHTLDRMLPRPKWKLYKSLSISAALEQLRRRARISLVICEADLGPGAWRFVLDEIQQLPNTPLMILVSRLADERLWAEALNLGAYDVLAKPFDAAEVNRALNSAWRWQHRRPLAGVKVTSRRTSSLQLAVKTL